MTDSSKDVLIVGGGIAGLTTALTLHQLGIPCQVFEAAEEPRPLGVGINIQPNAVRELLALDITEAELDSIGIQSREWALVGLNGNDIYAEPRGLLAGYKWPQYAVHRGELQMLLYRKVLERLGPHAVKTGHQGSGFTQSDDGSVQAHFTLKPSSENATYTGKLLIGADGINSAIRTQMHPDQPPIHWGGTIMWRGVTRAKAARTGSTFLGLGTEERRLVIYPISQPDENGLSLINWIAEIRNVSEDEWHKTGWFSQVEISDFLHYFTDMKYDWLDVPGLISQGEVAYENPMIDRDPIETWVSGSVLLLGDAAHPMYPTGSNGASQAIVDARNLGAAFLEHGLNAKALKTFDAAYNGPINDVVLRNRGDGPFGLLGLVEERCGGVFDDIEAILPAEERTAFMKRYQTAAGFARDTLNSAPPIIEPGSRL
ncbi:MAG: flavin-dependent oxidoreductase [Alphaproteobacteria bacterium]